MTADRQAVILLVLRWYLGLALFLPFLYAFAYSLPFLETIGGLALLVGWQTRSAFLLLGCLLVLLGFGTTLGGRVPMTASNLVFLAGCLYGYWHADADRYGLSGWRRSHP